ncbi:MAG: hypothetical protein WB607_15130 [Candidatus Acidiferrum sp.]|jgi:hypothetical protein
MFSAILFTISIVALAQFALYYWRAVLAGVAAQPIPMEILEAAQVEESRMCGADFEKLASLLILTPELKRAHGGLGFVPTYFKLIGKVSNLFGQISPALTSWVEQERTLCARFAAVQVGRRLEANLAQAASMRSI